jgi:H+/Cl- antiporter ClcA
MDKNIKNKGFTYALLDRWYDFRVKLVFEGILVGLFAGLTVVFYRYMLDRAGAFRENVYVFLKTHGPWPILLWFLVLAAVGIIIGLLVKKEPLISGSGIPQVEGVLMREIKMNWLRVILGKLLGGILSIGAGLSLGREGPSIQIGASAGLGFSRISKRQSMEEKYLITCGAGAGLAAAFGAPLAGVVFVLEEVHKNFSPLILTSAMAASLTADFVSNQFFGVKPIFNFKLLSMLPMRYYYHLIILGIIIGILGALFNGTLIRTADFFKQRIRIPEQYKIIIPIMAAGILGFVLPQILGGGHELIVSLSEGSFTLNMLLLLAAAKFIFTMISYGSGAPGGIFLPLLSIGALIGGIYGIRRCKFFTWTPCI